MVNQKNLAIAALLITVAVIAFFVFFQSDEAKIKKKFNQLAASVEKDGDEHDLIAAKKAHAIEQMFAGSVRIQIPSYSVDKTFPRSEISPHALYARSLYAEMELEFHDFRFHFPEENRAAVGLTAVFKAVNASGEPVYEFHEAECTLEKIDDEWMFTGIRGVEVLEK